MNRERFAVIPVLVFLAVGALIFSAQGRGKQVVDITKHNEAMFMPGTQPNELTDLDSPNRCRMCHAPRLETAPYPLWQGSMMAQAARDPLFYAALAIANQDIPGSGDFCLRCHTPQGWLLGRSEPTDGSALAAEDLSGVTCDACHRLVDPFSREGKSLVKGEAVPDYGNGMYVVSKDTAKRGPLPDTNPPHEAKYSEFHRQGRICGTCHDVTNPVNKVPIERTYSEWEQSWFAGQGDSGSCQACHMKAAAGYVAEPQLKAAKKREKIARHDLTGGSNWVYDALPLLWPDLDKELLAEGKRRAQNTLSRAAKIEITYRQGETLRVAIKVINETGHKLPTGYPEGRRMWLHVRGFDAGGKSVFESGGYDRSNAELIEDRQLKVYKAKPAIKGKGPTFHFVLNDYIAFDNRIPPKGFTNAAFEKVGAGVIGYKYKDGQNWDVTDYVLPGNTAAVTAALMYQSSEKEYIEFLAENNRSDDWGRKLIEVWEKTGKGAPVVMVEATASIE